MTPELSILIVSFNTKELLKNCLTHLYAVCKGVTFEIIVIDNHSKDGSLEMVARDFPSVIPLSSEKNIGFGAANNLGFQKGKGNFFLLLNSDAFPEEGVIEESLKRIKSDSKIGYGGCRLTDHDGSLQPSARLFPSFLNLFLEQSGLARKFPKSRFFGRYNRTWADPQETAFVDWVPGAYALIPKKALEEVGGFDERFFLYFEEVDFCRRLKKQGWKIVYWGDLRVVHLGGQSAATQTQFTQKSSQIELWRLRSNFLYHRKYGGFWKAWFSKAFEITWHFLRRLKNFNHPEKKHFSETEIKLINQAWKETKRGTYSPPAPW